LVSRAWRPHFAYIGPSLSLLHWIFKIHSQPEQMYMGTYDTIVGINEPFIPLMVHSFISIVCHAAVE